MFLTDKRYKAEFRSSERLKVFISLEGSSHSIRVLGGLINHIIGYLSSTEYFYFLMLIYHGFGSIDGVRKVEMRLRSLILPTQEASCQ